MEFGIVGAGGYWGPNWVRVLKQLGYLGAICEVDAKRVKQVVERFELNATDVALLNEFDDMLKLDLDGIFIVTPPASHAVLAVKAMRAGKHVFIEKPLADELEDCYKIKFEAEQLDRIAMVGHTFIYHPAVRKFKESLENIGKLRTLYTVRANFGLYQDVGVVPDLLPHDMSIFTYLCEGFPDEVRAEVNPHQDVAYVTARYGEVSCSAFLSWSYPEKTRKLVAVGEKGILEWDLSWTHILFHRKWVEGTAGGRFEHFDKGTQEIAVEDQSEPLMNEALHFAACIRNHTQPFTGIEDGINVVKGLEACRTR